MASAVPDHKTATSIHEFSAKNIKGEEVKLDIYKGHVCIIVNVASQCGLTANNYKQLNELYDQYAESKGKSEISCNVANCYEICETVIKKIICNNRASYFGFSMQPVCWARTRGF